MRNEALTYVKKFYVSIKGFGQKILGVTEARMSFFSVNNKHVLD